jgi:hypothetical protein
LRLDTLAVGRDAGVAVFHVTIMQQISAAKKRNRFNALILLHNSWLLLKFNGWAMVRDFFG